MWDEHLVLTEMKTKLGIATAATKPSGISDTISLMASILKAKGARLNTLFSPKFRGEGKRSESLPHC